MWVSPPIDGYCFKVLMGVTTYFYQSQHTTNITNHPTGPLLVAHISWYFLQCVVSSIYLPFRVLRTETRALMFLKHITPSGPLFKWHVMPGTNEPMPFQVVLLSAEILIWYIIFNIKCDHKVFFCHKYVQYVYTRSGVEPEGPGGKSIYVWGRYSSLSYIRSHLDRKSSTNTTIQYKYMLSYSCVNDFEESCSFLGPHGSYRIVFSQI